MKHVKIPYWLVIKYYWKRLLAVSAIWFLYDFSTYSFGIFSSTILTNVMPADAPLSQSFGWNTVINLFYVPGAMFGSILSDVRNIFFPHINRAPISTGRGMFYAPGFVLAPLYSRKHVAN
jgi:hypothetical protein